MSPVVHSNAFEAYYLNIDGTVLCVGNGATSEEAHKSAVTDLFRRFMSTTCAPSPTVASPSSVKYVEVVYVGPQGIALCCGKGSTRDEAEKKAFTEALRLLNTQVLSDRESTKALSQSSATETVSTALPSSVDSKVGQQRRELRTFFVANSSTCFAVVGKPGSGRLSACLNLISRMSNRYTKVTILTSKGREKRFCGLPVASFYALPSIAENAAKYNSKQAVIVHGRCSYGLDADPTAIAGIIEKAMSSDMVDVYFTCEFMDELTSLKLKPNLLLVTHDVFFPTISAVKVAATPRSSRTIDQFYDEFKVVAPSAGHAMGIVDTDDEMRHFEYLPWNEIASFPPRLLA